jgi:hypothetical protein
MPAPTSDCAIIIMVRKGFSEVGQTGRVVTFSIKRDTERQGGYYRWHFAP